MPRRIWSAAYKPQFAHYAAHGAEEQLERTIEYIHHKYPHVPVILDSKRGDVGNTAERYALEAFERYGADAVTVNPYLGGDSLEPFLKHADKGVIILCRTSNPGARDMQDLEVAAASCITPLPSWRRSAGIRGATACWSSGRPIRESWPKCARSSGDMPLARAGCGRAGRRRCAARENGQTANGTGLIISSSRAILYASSGDDFAGAARTATPRCAIRSISTATRVDETRGDEPLASSSLIWRSAACSQQLRTRRAPARHRPVLLRGNGAEPDSLDPQKARSIEAHTILRDLCEGLTRSRRMRASRRGSHVTGKSAPTARPTRSICAPRRAGPTAIPSSQRISSLACGGWSIPQPPRNTRRSSTSSSTRPTSSRQEAAGYARRFGAGRRHGRNPARRARALCAGPALASEHVPVHRATFAKLGAQMMRPGVVVSNGAFVLNEWVQGSHVLASAITTTGTTARPHRGRALSAHFG